MARLKSLLMSHRMPRWIVFDRETSSALQARLSPEDVVETSSQPPLKYVLERQSTVVAVLPAPGQNESVLAVFRWNRIPRPGVLKESPSVQAGGFLGLTDEPIPEDHPQEKKSWWRLWE